MSWVNSEAIFFPFAAGSVERIAEVAYIPVHDVANPQANVVAVLEIFISACAAESMMIANVISCFSNILTELQVKFASLQDKLEG